MASEWGTATATVDPYDPPVVLADTTSAWGTATAVVEQEAPAVVGASGWGTATATIEAPTVVTTSGVVVWDGSAWQPATPVHWDHGTGSWLE